MDSNKAVPSVNGRVAGTRARREEGIDKTPVKPRDYAPPLRECAINAKSSAKKVGRENSRREVFLGRGVRSPAFRRPGIGLRSRNPTSSRSSFRSSLRLKPGLQTAAGVRSPGFSRSGERSLSATSWMISLQAGVAPPEGGTPNLQPAGLLLFFITASISSASIGMSAMRSTLPPCWTRMLFSKRTAKPSSGR